MTGRFLGKMGDARQVVAHGLVHAGDERDAIRVRSRELPVSPDGDAVRGTRPEANARRCVPQVRRQGQMEAASGRLLSVRSAFDDQFLDFLELHRSGSFAPFKQD